LQFAGAGDERAEKQRRHDRRQRMELREQRDRDAGVAVAGGEALEEAVRDAEELDAAGQSGGGAGEGHRTRELRAHVDARPLRRERIEAGRAQAQTFGGMSDQPPSADAHEQRERNAGVQFADCRKRSGGGIALRILRDTLAQRTVHTPAEKVQRGEVQQDRSQHFGRVAPQPHGRGDRRPRRAGEHRREQRRGDAPSRGKQARECADDELSFAADVPDARAKRDGDAQSGQQQRNGFDDGPFERETRSNGSADEDRQQLQR
jgi:hypothetical protein